ncbi:MAG TPA: carboxypeptidase-like regulatory domain-containing protein [Candidatus Thermoplasmatota archaeon]|nr:carboxypeptidase-like regulatory domain-containing protein [Candidatus Thermoplasmatota archaeon]
MQPQGAAAVLAAFLLLAGCASAARDPGADEAGTTAVPLPGVDAEAATGALSGLVVDPTITPVAGAIVQVKGLARNFTTGANGAFEVLDLRPGVYFLEVQAPRFLVSQSSAEVVAGQAKSVRIVLEGDGKPLPKHSTEKFKGHADLDLGVLAPDILPLQCNCVFATHPEAGFRTFVVEGKGTTSTPRPPAPPPVDKTLAQVWWTFLDKPQTHGLGYQYTDFPFSQHVPGKLFPNGTDEIDLTVSGNQWPNGQMDFEVFVTTFYWEAAPEGWSFLKGDE